MLFVDAQQPRGDGVAVDEEDESEDVDHQRARHERQRVHVVVGGVVEEDVGHQRLDRAARRLEHEQARGEGQHREHPPSVQLHDDDDRAEDQRHEAEQDQRGGHATAPVR
jgi:hypothetical protein